MENKSELTWDRICEQIGKKRIDPTARDIFGKPLDSSSSTTNQDKEKTNDQ